MLRRHSRQPPESGEQNPSVSGRKLSQRGRQPVEVEDAVPSDTCPALSSEDDRKSALVIRVSAANEKAPPFEALYLLGRRALGYTQVASHIAERDAVFGGDVVEQLALMLREIHSVRLEEFPPKLTVQLIELFGIRLVRHAVQYTGFTSES